MVVFFSAPKGIVPAICFVVVMFCRRLCFNRLLKHCFNVLFDVLSMHSPILASVPSLFVGIAHAKKPGAIFLPRKISTYFGSKSVFSALAPMPFKNSVGFGKLKVLLIFECGPSAPISREDFVLVVCSFWTMLSSICLLFFSTDDALAPRWISTPASSASFIISWSNLGRSITNACLLSPPIVKIFPEGEWMWAP